ncbi:MAG: hypothetical protein KBF66_03850 [Rhodoferax sp.]|nr:hypothetical protein [Rhodoferax sp.]
MSGPRPPTVPAPGCGASSPHPKPLRLTRQTRAGSRCWWVGALR